MNKPDIVETLMLELNLRKSGQNYKTLCPFHVEKTPSFVVSPTRQTAHCFGGCGWHGDVIKFIQDYKGLSFKDALAYLGISNGRKVKPDPIKLRARGIRKQYETWKDQFTLHLADILRRFDQKKLSFTTMEQVEQYSYFYHRAILWELYYQILMSNDEQSKFALFREGAAI